MFFFREAVQWEPKFRIDEDLRLDRLGDWNKATMFETQLDSNEEILSILLEMK